MSPTQEKVTRRRLLVGAGALGLAAAAAGGVMLSAARRIPVVRGAGRPGPSGNAPHGIGNSFGDFGAQDVIYTVCEQCNTHCTIAVRLQEGADGRRRVRKIAGNPYSPLNTVPFGPIPYETGPEQAAAGAGPEALRRTGRSLRGGRTCLKGQAGIQTVYDRLRLTRPLRRAGPRGSGRWESVSWEEALDEIVNGSKVLGTPGLRDVWAYVSQEQVQADLARLQAGQLSQEAFRERYRNVLIDPDVPQLGPRANQVVNLGGDRRDFMHGRFWPASVGSLNAYDHGGVCGASGVLGTVRSFNPRKKKQRLYVDLQHCEFAIVWGTNPMVANKGPTWLAPALTEALARGMKMAVIDPRLSETANKAHWWVPIAPGTDGALALGMARWIVEHGRYDARYLANPNREAARADGEPTWTDATHLVRLDRPERPKLRLSDLGMTSKEEDDYVVALPGGKVAAAGQAPEGVLEFDGRVGGIPVKSVFTLFKERVLERTLEEYASISGVDVETIERLAAEFTSHGKRVGIIAYRGPAMHANGYEALRAINALNHLVGNHDWKGGSITTGAHFQELKGRYDLLAVPGGLKPWGIPLARNGVAYERTPLFQRDGYPARRPWFPLGGNTVQEVLASAAEGYPYRIGALFVHRLSPVLSLPAGSRIAETLKDTRAIPLLVVMDVEMSETASFADFVLPDLTYLERWGRETIYPNALQRISSVMQPVVRAFDGPRAVEDVWIAIGRRMGWPGVGEGAFADGGSLESAEDFYLKMVANIALDRTPVPDASPAEMEMFEKSRRTALGPAFDVERWKRAVRPEEWPKVVTVLNRGGRFEPPGQEYEGEWVRYRLEDEAHFYDEGTAAARHPYDGRLMDGLPRWQPPVSFAGKPLEQVGTRGLRRPLRLINWKARHIGTHRNIQDAWLREIASDNPLWIHPADAAARGIRNGDRVRIRSALLEVEGRALVTQAIRPGTVGACYNFGHFAYGAAGYTIDGHLVKPARRYGHTPFRLGGPGNQAGYAAGRGEGFSVNHLLPEDPDAPGAGVSDVLGAGAAQYDVWVDVSRA
ncbi:MAG: molybdopterin-dependent oxidoreductase [Limnochordaceae bacterium]|nr:molybdopterin-dependent oxidoreductase [Limnochordaceae bacterium]